MDRDGVGKRRRRREYGGKEKVMIETNMVVRKIYIIYMCGSLNLGASEIQVGKCFSFCAKVMITMMMKGDTIDHQVAKV